MKKRIEFPREAMLHFYGSEKEVQNLFGNGRTNTVLTIAGMWGAPAKSYYLGIEKEVYPFKAWIEEI